MKTLSIIVALVVLVSLSAWNCRTSPQEVERPEKIVSLRQVGYDSATYAKLAGLWKKYYDVYPSEDAYANWMYAARYASDKNYESLLARGVEKYPSNPTLIYLTGINKLNRQEIVESDQLMEKAASLDPYYMDPWFGLAVSYLAQGDREKQDGALRKLLSSGIIDDAIMDFCYNMIASMDTNAILITNGDNDTYPCWILTRIIRFRPDVNIVNRPLLNTKWYPVEIVKEGVMPFIKQSGLDSLRQEVSLQGDSVNAGKIPNEKFVTVGDRLVVRIIESARKAGRPVYFACTLSPNAEQEELLSSGRRLGLVTLVTPPKETYSAQLQKLFRTWVSEFRTAGLDSWQLHAAAESRSSRRLVSNYIAALHRLIGQIKSAGPTVELPFFRWYRDHCVDFVSKESALEINGMWCDTNSPQEIKDWCRRLGLEK